MLRAWNSTATVTAVQQREHDAFHLTSDKTSLQRSAKGRGKEDYMNTLGSDLYENFPEAKGITWRWKFSNLSAFNSTVALVRRSGGREPGKFSSSWIL